MTRRGIGLIAAAIVLFLLADMTRTGWIQFADSLLWAIVVVGIALPLLSLPALEASLAIVTPAKREGLREGDAVTLVVRIRNRWFWPRFGLRVTGELQTEGRKAKPVAIYIPFIAPRGDVAVRGEVVIGERGLYRLQKATIESSAPAAILRRRRRLTAGSQALVLPAPFAFSSGDLSRPAEGALPKNRPARTGEDVAGSRPYVPGDPARALHWRNFARTGRLMTKAHTAAAGNTPVLVIVPPGEIEPFDQVARLAAGVVEAWTKDGGRVRWQNGTAEVQQTRDEMMRVLAVAAASNISPAVDSLRWLAPNAAAAVVVSASDQAGLRQVAMAATRLSSRLTVLLVASPAALETEEARGSLSRAGAAVLSYRAPVPSAVVPPGEHTRRAA